PAPIDDVLVPAGLHKGDPSRVAIGYRGVVLTFGHGSASSNETSWGVRASLDDTPCARHIFPFSSIRTVTVGFGIAPNLLTPPIARRGRPGFGDRSPPPP